MGRVWVCLEIWTMTQWLESSGVYGGEMACECFCMLSIRTCPSRCPAGCWDAERRGRFLCCGLSSCRSSPHPPTRQTVPGYLHDRRDVVTTLPRCICTWTDIFTLRTHVKCVTLYGYISIVRRSTFENSKITAPTTRGWVTIEEYLCWTIPVPAQI